MNMCIDMKRSEHVLNPQKVDPIREIMRYVSNHPKSSEYRIGKETKVHRIMVMRKIKPLADEGYLHKEVGKRNANHYSLTFKGLIYALKIGAIKPEEAREIRLKNDIPLPEMKVEEPLGYLFLQSPEFSEFPFPELAQYMEEKHPEALYKFISEFIIKLDKINDESMPLFFMISGFLSLIQYYVIFPKNTGYFFKGKDLILEDGTRIIDFLKILPITLFILRPLIDSHGRQIMDQKIKELLALLPKD